MTGSPFDHERDRELGKALRNLLSGNDNDAFVQRVLARVAEVKDYPASATAWWEVLSGWARPGLAAAAIGLLLTATIWITGLLGGGAGQVALGDPLLPLDDTELSSVLMARTQPPDLNEVLALGLEGDR